MQKIVFELCAETSQACHAAREGGANRIELCSALGQDGLTPSHGFIRAAVDQSGLPVYVLLRPRGGDFVYTDDEFLIIQEDLRHARELNVAGFALGILREDNTVDVERTRHLVEMAAPLEVTFHRAFDLTSNLDEALEDVIATGCKRILTSGGKSDVVTGAFNLAKLVERSAGRIEIAAGGGLRIDNAEMIARTSRCSHFHGSVRRPVSASLRTGVLGEGLEYEIDSNDVRALIGILRSGQA